MIFQKIPQILYKLRHASRVPKTEKKNSKIDIQILKNYKKFFKKFSPDINNNYPLPRNCEAYTTLAQHLALIIVCKLGLKVLLFRTSAKHIHEVFQLL